MFVFEHVAFLLLSAFTTVLVITYGIIPVVIHIAELKHLVDIPGERSLHNLQNRSYCYSLSFRSVKYQAFIELSYFIQFWNSIPKLYI